MTRIDGFSFKLEKQYTERLYSALDNYAVGRIGEEFFTALLHPRWKSELHARGCGGDVQVTDRLTGLRLCVEVKASRLHYLPDRKRYGWQFGLYKHDKHGATDYRKADFVALIGVSPLAGQNQYFLIPVAELRAKKLAIAPSVVGKYEQFRVKSRIHFLVEGVPQ